MPENTRWSTRFLTLALLCVACACAVLLVACSDKDETDPQRSTYTDADYAAIADGSLVGRDIHFSGVVDFPYHDDESDWQGYLVAVDGVETDIVAVWYDAAPDAEWIADGSTVEVWGTLDGLSYTDTNDGEVDVPHVTISTIEATTLEEADGDEGALINS